MKRTKRFLSILLTLCMVLGMIPQSCVRSQQQYALYGREGLGLSTNWLWELLSGPVF